MPLRRGSGAQGRGVSPPPSLAARFGDDVLTFGDALAAVACEMDQVDVASAGDDDALALRAWPTIVVGTLSDLTLAEAPVPSGFITVDITRRTALGNMFKMGRKGVAYEMASAAQRAYACVLDDPAADIDSLAARSPGLIPVHSPMLSAERREREISRCADAINTGAKLFLVCCGLEDCHGVPLGYRIMERAAAGTPAAAAPRSREWTLAQMARGEPFPVGDPRWCEVTASGAQSGFYAHDRENAATVAALAAGLEAPVGSDGSAVSQASALLDGLPLPSPPPADAPGAASSRALGPSSAACGSLGAGSPSGCSQVRPVPPHVSLPSPEHEHVWWPAECAHCPRTWWICAPEKDPSKGCGAEWGGSAEHDCTHVYDHGSTGSLRLTPPPFSALQDAACGGHAPAVVDAEPLTLSEPGFRLAAPESPHKRPLAALSTGAAQRTAGRGRPVLRRPSHCPPPVGIAA